MFTTVLLAGKLNENIRINGYSGFEFEKMFGDEGKGDPNGSFDSDLFDLVFNVTTADYLRIAADITWEHGAATEDGRGNAAVEYVFCEYLVRDWLKFRAGKMFTPFGIYNEIHTAKPVILTVNEPLSTKKTTSSAVICVFIPDGPRDWPLSAILGSGKFKPIISCLYRMVGRKPPILMRKTTTRKNPSPAVSAYHP
ncbi:hypothetical protein JW948_17815 [bacterium]|nr:hypothetical protein [bacterium]